MTATETPEQTTLDEQASEDEAQETDGPRTVTQQMLDALAADTPDDEIHQRTAMAKNGQQVMKDGVPLLLNYVTARFVQDRLDTVVGQTNWRDEYVDLPTGAVRCGISIRVDGEWITKWDVGIPSSIEPVKGAHSDAFKRAGVKWGIARDLYDTRDEDEAPAAASNGQVMDPAQAQQVMPRGAPIQQQVGEAVGQPQPVYAGTQQVGQQVPTTGSVYAGQPTTQAEWLCPIHGISKVVPAGISKRTGRPYAAFYACDVSGCTQKGPSVTQ